VTGGFDLVLGLALILCAVGALASRDLFRAIVMFIVFSLLMALVWVRLQAPDIALAEAAIGAGLTGVLLLDTLGYLRRRFERPHDATPAAQGKEGAS
jgi:energy-converting hydrogenase B subunit D